MECNTLLTLSKALRKISNALSGLITRYFNEPMNLLSFSHVDHEMYPDWSIYLRIALVKQRVTYFRQRVVYWAMRSCGRINNGSVGLP